MRFRYKAKEKNEDSFLNKAIGFIYNPNKKKSNLSNEYYGYVEAENEQEATSIAKRHIKKFAPNCSLTKIYEVRE